MVLKKGRPHLAQAQAVDSSLGSNREGAFSGAILESREHQPYEEG